jgi:transposase
MKPKTRLRKNTRFSEKKILQIVEYFCDDCTADYTSKKLSISGKTIDDWYMYLRKVILWYQERERSEVFGWTVEMDESYFWPTRIKWKRWRWAGGKTIVFGLLKREGKVYTEIVPDAKAKSIIPIIRRKVEPDTEMNTDGWWAYDGLVDMGYEKHYRVFHWKNEFVRGKQHVNGIESFWSFTKRRLRKFNWIQRQYFLYHLKESEFRYNVRVMHEDMFKKLVKMMKIFNKQLL